MTRIAAAAAVQADEAPRVGVGHNRPPLDVEARASFDDMLNQRTGFRQRIEDLLGSASRAVATTKEEAGRCGELVKQIRAAIAVVDDAHETTKRPYLEAGRAVDAAKKELVSRLDDAKRLVEGKQTTFLREEDQRRQAEIRRAREAEEARLRAEREAAAAAAPVEAGHDELEPLPVYVPEPQADIIRGDFGAAVSGQKVWVSQVVDYEVAFIAVANNEKVREAIDKAVSSMVRGGVHQIEGVRIWQDVKVSNR